MAQASSNGAASTSSRREVSFSERYSSMDTQKVVLTANSRAPRELGAGQVAKLSWEEHVAIWQVSPFLLFYLLFQFSKSNFNTWFI